MGYNTSATENLSKGQDPYSLSEVTKLRWFVFIRAYGALYVPHNQIYGRLLE
jgi:hypothetical protein